MLFPPGLEYVGAFFGCLYARAVPVPAYPPRPNRSFDRLRAIVNDARPAIALTTEVILAQIGPRLAQSPELQSLRWEAVEAIGDAEAEAWLRPRIDEDTLALLQYTSGSTSTPKGVSVSHGNLLYNERMIQRAFEQDERSVIAGWLPLFHDMGLIGNVLQPLYAGARCILLPPLAFLQRPACWLEAITRYQATTSGGPNFAYDLCVRKIRPEQRESLQLSSWTVAFNGAEPVHRETLDRFAEAFAPCGFRREAFYPCYGLAEATLFVSGGVRMQGARTRDFQRAGLERNCAVPAEGEVGARSLVSCGTAWLEQRIQIVDPASETPLEPGAIGEIWASGPSVAKGYWNRPEESELTFRARLAGRGEETFLRTGDLGFVLDDELYVTGRLKDLLIIRGRNHYPQDIERTVERCDPALRPGEGAAFSVEVGGEERLVVVQEVTRGTHPQDLTRTVEAIRRAVAEEHEIQTYAIVLLRAGSILKTSSGKIQRRALRHAFLDGSLAAIFEWRAGAAQEMEDAAPLVAGTELAAVEEWIAARVAARLGFASREIDLAQPLVRYGLDSLADIELLHAIEQELGASLPMLSFLQDASITDLAVRVVEQLSALPSPAAAAAPPDAELGEIPLSRGQQALWFLHRLAPESAAYNVAGAAWIRGPLSAAALERSFQALADRHAALRVCFETRGDTPVQIAVARLAVPFFTEDATGWPEWRLRARLAEEAASPFDLVAEPGFRVHCWRCEGEHLLLFVAHHIVIDLWSLAVMVRELGEIYGAEVSGRAAVLPGLQASYGDYVRWQEEQLAGKRGERLWEFWRRALAGDLPLLELATDRPHPLVQTFAGAAASIRLDPRERAGIEALAASSGATLFAVLLAAYQTLLHRYSGQDEVVIGFPSAGRLDSRFDLLVGYFVNPLAVPLSAAGDPGFRELAARVRASALAVLEHQDLPFALLVDRLQPERDPGRSPIFQTMFVLQQAPAFADPSLVAFALGEEGGRLRLGPLTLESARLEQRLAQFDLTMAAAPIGGELIVSLQYNTDLFDATTIQRMLGHFRTLLGGILNRPDGAVSTLPLLAGSERHQLLTELNDTARVDPAGSCLHHLFERQAALTPGAVALVSSSESLTYGELDARADRLALHLRRRGVGLEVVVGVLMERGAELVVALLGVLKAGGAYLPLDPGYPRDRLVWMLADARVPVLLASERPEWLPVGGPEVILPAEWEGEPQSAAVPPAGAVSDRNLAYLIYTSGSTGWPKGIALEHRSTVAMVRWCLEAFTPEALRCSLAATSVCFDVSVAELFAPLSCGGALFMVRDALDLRVSAHAGEVTAISIVPSVLRELLRGGPLPTSVTTLNLGGEPLSHDLVEQAYAQPGVSRVFNLYGPSEDTVYTTFSLVRAGALAAPTIGRPTAGNRIYVVRGGELQPAGLTGELVIGGGGLARGYLHRPDLTAERFVPDSFGGEPGARLYRTGDLGRRRTDGEIEYLGRLDHQVKVRGFRIELGEIEAVLRRHPSVTEAVVMAREDRPGDQRLVAYLTVRPGAAPALAQLRELLGGRLPAFMIPQVFVTLDAFPLTGSGKIDRRSLPALDRARPAGESDACGPRTAVEEIVAGVWEEVLGLDSVGVVEDFFELGGHSLHTTRVVARLNKIFQIELPVRALFEARTVRSLAAVLEKASRSWRGTPLPALERVPRGDRLPLTFAQERLWFLHCLQPESAAYNLAFSARFEGDLDRATLARSLERIVHRHEALRTTFGLDNGYAVQRVGQGGPAPLAVTDLRALPASRRESAARGLEIGLARHPFDLERGPLLRFVLLQLGEREGVLTGSMHHIVSDGWSLGLFLAELETSYSAFLAGACPVLPELTIQVPDYAAWQRSSLTAEALAPQLAYWKDRLSGAPALLDLPVDHPRPVVAGWRGASAPFSLERPLAAALARLGRRDGGTLFMVLLAAFQALLSRYSGQRDMLVGVPVAHRGQLEIEPLIGCFVNTLVLRADLSEDPGFRDLLGQVRETALAGYVNQDVPFEKVVGELGVDRNLGHAPLFQAMMALQSGLLRDLDLGGIRLRPEELDTGTAKLDLTLHLAGGEAGLSGRWEYRSDLFEPATIQRLAGHFAGLLAEIAAEPGRRLSDIHLLTAAERQQLLVEWNDTSAAPSAEMGLHRLFELQAARVPGAVALVAGGRELDYAQLDGWAGRWAHRLRSLGVGPEVRVGLLFDRSTEMVVAMLAVLKAGGVYVPLDPEHPPARLRWLLEDAGAAMLLTVDRLADRVSWSPQLSLDVGVRETEPLFSTRVEPASLAYVIYTSGSTGRPKGVMISHDALSSYLGWSVEAYDLAAGGGAPVHSPLGFDLTVTSLWGPLVSGGTVDLLPSARGVEALQASLETAGAPYSLLKLTPSHLEALGQELKPLAASRVRLLVVGGEALSGRDLAFWALHAPKVEVVNEYGPTEATVGCCVYRRQAGELGVGAIPIGRPIANTRLYLLDSTTRPVPAGIPGELFISGAGLARGYLNRPDLSAERFLPDPFSGREGARMYRTGDLARARPDGSFEFLGRTDQQVKIRGFRIELGEVEAALMEQPGVEQAVTVARDDLGVLQLVAYIVGWGVVGDTELRAGLRERLPEPMLPAAIVRLETFPLTANGKIDRAALPAPDRRDEGVCYAAPRTHEEELLAGIWKQVLRRDRVGVHDNFFTLGGDSILSIQVIARANQAGLRLTPQDLFQHQSIAELARGVRPVASPGEGEPAAEPVPLTSAQRRHLEQAPDGAGNSRVAELNVEAGLSRVRLEEAVAALWRRHDALRLRFARDTRGWRCEVAPESSAQWARVDLSGLPTGFEGRALAAAIAQVRADLDPVRGPVARIVLLERNDGWPDRLVVAAHPLAVDRTSLGVLVEDLETACRQAHRGEPIVLPQCASFRQWAARLAEREATPRWRAEMGPEPKSARRRGELPPPGGEAVEEGGPNPALFCLSSEETRSLLDDVPRAYGTAVDDALLFAVAQAFFKWTGEPSLLVDVWRPMRKGDGEGLDAVRTVGCLDDNVPALLHLGAARGPGEALKAIKEQLRQFPGPGVGSSEVGFRGPGPVSLLDGPRSLAPIGEHAPGEAGPHPISVDCDLVGDQLRLAWLSRRGDNASTLETLAVSCGEALRALIAHCLDPENGSYTPSDFPRVGIAQRDLDELVASRPGAGRGALEDIYPLTPLQQGMLFHILENPGSGIYLNQQCFTLQGELDEETLRAAFERVIARHPALRTAVVVGSRGEPFQVVWHHALMPWRYLDWRSLSSDRLERELATLHRAEGEMGFELSREPLIRPTLIRLGDDAYRFVWSFHLILLDGWSIPLIFSEVLAFYDALRRGREPDLAPPAPYSHYIDWLERQDRVEAEAYWRRTFEGFTPLSFDESGTPWETPGQEADYLERELRLDPADVARLRTFARESQLTLNTLVQGAWALHLCQREGTEDVIFGSVVSGRPADLPGVESTVGLFLNTLPVRVRVAPERLMLPWLVDLQTQQAEARRYEFSGLVDIQKWSGLPGRRVLFDTVVIFQNIPLDPSLLDPKRNLRVLSVSSTERNNYPLTLVIIPDAELVLRIVYDRRRFRETAVTRILEKLRRLLLEIASRPGGSLASFSPSSAVERQQLVHDFNQALE
jgi:amino acid adenylation domain-containing protein